MEIAAGIADGRRSRQEDTAGRANQHGVALYELVWRLSSHNPKTSTRRSLRTQREHGEDCPTSKALLEASQ